MLGAPEVINMNALLIKSLGGKKVIDVGVFTGASSLGAALALPEDGVVVACDVSEEVGPQISAAISNTVGADKNKTLVFVYFSAQGAPISIVSVAIR